MKKLFLALLTSSLVFTSCTNNNGGGGGSDVLYVYLLTDINTTNDKEVKSSVKLEYGDLHSSGPSADFKFTTYPVLKMQTVLPQGGQTIKYTYKDKNKLVIEKFSKGETRIDSMLYNEQAMVDQIFVNNKPEPFNIKYNTNGYRSAIGNDTTFAVMNGNYESMMIKGEVVVEYQYSEHPNVIGLQQFGIVGEPNMWQSERFGKQSRNLLDRVIVKNGEETVNYTFSYMANGNGLILEEIIKKDGKTFLTNKYSYQVGVVTPVELAN